jgi:hypothetical protein
MPSTQPQMNPQWSKVQLPSGLGAGGRGKEKAPCRYLHYEIDWDAGDAGTEAKWEERSVKKPHRLILGLGPKAVLEPRVSCARLHLDALLSYDIFISFLLSGSIVMFVALITQFSENSTLSWRTHRGIFT